MASGVEAARVGAPAVAGPEVALSPVGVGQVQLQWNAVRYPMAMIRDRVTGQVLTIARGGNALVAIGPFGLDRLQVLVSDGVKSRPWDPR